MRITRIGKIGRLPKHIRDQLGHRIEDAEPGTELVKWLNELSCVREILKEQFDGRAITEQNLSEWKQTGHPEWLRREEARLVVTTLTEQSRDLDEATDGHEISDRFASVLAAELASLAMTLLEKESDPEKRWQRLCAVHREFSQLRRDDHRAVRTVIKRDRWNREVAREEEEELERMKQENKRRQIDMCFSTLHRYNDAKLFGGGKNGEIIAEMIHRIKFDLSLDDLIDDTQLPSGCQSDEIKPNPS